MTICSEDPYTTEVKNTRGGRVIRFIERYCIVPDGMLLGKPIKLEDFQKKFILDVYNNESVTSRAYLSIARKNGKTALIASILLAHLVGPEAIENSQIISGARSKEQAALVFELACKMIRMSPALSSIIRIVPSSKRLIGLRQNVSYIALSAEGKTAHGNSPVLAILDEVGQVRGSKDDFVQAITTSQAAHANPLLIAISTQAPSDADLFSIWIDDAKQSKDPRIVSHVYCADDDCDLLDEAQWYKANPALDVFRSLLDLKSQAEQAYRMPSSEPGFRNLILNQRVQMVSPFVSRSVWRLNDGMPLEYDGEPVYVGLDLSATTDLTAMVIAWQSGDIISVMPYFWTPADTVVDRSKRDRAPYDVWAKQGYMHAIGGKSINYDQLAQQIMSVLSVYDVAKIAFDRWRMDFLKAAFGRLEVDQYTMDKMEPFGQGYASISPALAGLETALLEGVIRHGAHPVLTMCAANAVVTMDAAGNRKLDKSKTTGRIDGMVALTMACGSMAKDAEMNAGILGDLIVC